MKNCPSCRLIHPDEAQWCECGHRFDAAVRADGDGAPPEPATCGGCGARERVADCGFHWNVGLVVLRTSGAAEGTLCRTCMEWEFWRAMTINVWLGWWGCLSLFLTPLHLFASTGSYLAARRALRGSAPRNRSYVQWMATCLAGCAVLVFAFVKLVLAMAAAARR